MAKKDKNQDTHFSQDSVKVLRPASERQLDSAHASFGRRVVLRLWGVNVSKERKQYFLENLSMQLSAGLDVLQALTALQDDARVRPMRRLIESITKDVAAGASLSSAIETTGILSPHVISLIHIGESSGKLAENLEVLAVEQEKEREFQSRIRTAMFYPVFVLGLTVAIGLSVAWFILPNILNVFESFNAQLPLPTRILIVLADFFQRYGSIALPAFIIGGSLLIYILFFFRPTRFIGQRIFFSIPGIRRLMIEIEIARMGYILGTLLASGLPIIDALNALTEAASLRMYEKMYATIRDRVASGDTFQEIFAESRSYRRILPLTIQQVIVSAEQSGSLADALKRIGVIYETKTENTTKNVSTIIEPILLVIVWLGVVLVALAVVLPIYSLIGNLNNGLY